MEWIRQLSARRAFVIAVAWPLTLAALPLIAGAVAKTYSFVLRWQSDGAGTYFVRVRIVSFALLAAIMFVPPLAFLGLWRATRP